MENFSNKGKNDHKKIILDIEKLTKVTNVMRELGYRIIVTIGSWDLLHIGHVRYLRKAKTHGDILVVGVDSDRAVKIYKGELRPIIPENERVEMLSYQGCVDFVTLIDDVDNNKKWLYELIKKIKPDVFIAVKDSYPKEQKEEIKQFCKKLVVLPRQAEETSTSRTIQDVVKKTLEKMLTKTDRR
ncbi:MAG TPA: hypothetical protein ENH26_02140 [Candidatus Wolfebacteria bacterium]|nr:hypothetical protein [Candidatus Wolfebacteria bacterium]